MTQSGVPRPRFGEEWLIAVLDSLSEGVVALDDDGAIIAANPAAERLLGFDLATDRYRPWRVLAWERLVDEAEAPIGEAEHPIASALASRQGQPSFVAGVPTRRGILWLQLATHVLSEAGGLAPEGIVISFQDVSDRIQAQGERERLIGLQREMMAAASHDLRTPLAVITATASLLHEDWDGLEEQRRLEGVAAIERQVGRLNRLVDDLALMSRLEGGGLVAKPTNVRASELIEAALDGLIASPDIQVAVGPGLVVTVDVDHGRRMLLNLVDNACKYGEPPVRVEATGLSDAIAITVSDAGPGVPEDFVGRLFDRFTRADPDAGGGMGLGLAIVDRLARLNHGSVTYQGTTEGARFRLTLPQGDLGP